MPLLVVFLWFRRSREVNPLTSVSYQRISQPAPCEQEGNKNKTSRRNSAVETGFNAKWKVKLQPVVTWRAIEDA